MLGRLKPAPQGMQQRRFLLFSKLERLRFLLLRVRLQPDGRRITRTQPFKLFADTRFEPALRRRVERRRRSDFP